jgi:GNAT superfamily N-acetyltransferase
MNFRIRPLRAEDVDTVVAFALRSWEPVFESFAQVLGPRLFASAYPDWRTSQATEIRENCRPEKNPCWVAEVDARAVGWLTLVHEPAESKAFIEMLAVAPEHQGKGIASELIETAIAAAKELGCKRIEVWTGGDPGHEPARRSYEKTGFTALPIVHYYREV